MCLLTNERYETYQMGFSFGRLDHASEVGLGGTCTLGVAGSKNCFPEIQPDLVCELREWLMQRHNFWPKGQISFTLKVLRKKCI